MFYTRPLFWIVILFLNFIKGNGEEALYKCKLTISKCNVFIKVSIYGLMEFRKA